MLLLVVGLGILTLSQTRLRTMSLERDWDEAALLAVSAIEQAHVRLNSDYSWRYVFRNNEGNFTTAVPLGRGEFRWKLDDLEDNDLNDSPTDSLRIHGFGRVGRSVRAYSVMAWPAGQPLDVLRTAVHAGGTLTVRNGQTLSVRNGPASSNAGLVVGNAVLLGSAEAATVDAPEHVTEAVTVPAPSKLMPSKTLYSLYKTFSDEIRYSDLDDASGANHFQGQLRRTLISPWHHPTDPSKTNSDGLYRIKVPGGTRLDIRDCRIEGTLLIELSLGASLRVDSGVLWKPYRNHFPALIVYTSTDANSTVELLSTGELSESSAGINVNALDLPYYGDVDVDQSDVYPTSLQGLFHVIRDTALPPVSLTTIRAEEPITGCIIADGNIEIDGTSTIFADPTLMSHPPLGYTASRFEPGLISNPQFNDGLTGWFVADGVSTLETDANGVSDRCLRARNRSVASSGPSQDVTGSITSGTTYRSDVWVRMKAHAEDVNIVMMVDSAAEGTQWFGGTVQTVGTSWTPISSTMTPTWTGSLNFARWMVNTASSTQDFYVDSILLVNADEDGAAAPNLELLPWTWRAEAAPNGL